MAAAPGREPGIAAADEDDGSALARFHSAQEWPERERFHSARQLPVTTSSVSTGDESWRTATPTARDEDGAAMEVDEEEDARSVFGIPGPGEQPANVDAFWGP